MAKATERKAVIQTVISEDKKVITFTVRGAGTLTLDLEKVSDAVKARALIHGLVQRVSDKAAIPCNTTTGLPATPAMKLEAMKSLVDHFMSGTDEWSPARAEGAGRKPKDELDPMVLAAIAEATGKDESHVRAAIKTLAESREVKEPSILAVLGATAAVQPILERMRAEQAEGVGLDGDELLEGL
jgi:hypothetical protein